MKFYDKEKACIQAIFQNFKNNLIYNLYSILFYGIFHNIIYYKNVCVWDVLA